MKERSKEIGKDIATGAAGLVVALAGGPGVLAAIAAPLAALGFVRAATSAQRRAEKLVERMLERDEEPESFAEELRRRVEADDEETLAAFRVLLVAAIQAVTPDALPAIGFVGQRLCRNRTSLRLARGAVDVLNQIDAVELRTLRKFMQELEAVHSEWMMVLTDIAARSDGSERAWKAYATHGTGSRAISITQFPNPQRLFGYLKRAGLGTDTGAYGVGGSPLAIELEGEAVALLRDALVATVPE